MSATAVQAPPPPGTAAALLRGPAPGIEHVITVRAVQGPDAALAASNGPALLLAPGREARNRGHRGVHRGRGAVRGGGLPLAGSLTTLSSWRWVLYPDAPLGLAILAL